MFLIKDKGVKALEHNLEETRSNLKKLEKDYKSLFLENEKLKIENLHYKQDAESYKKKYEITKKRLEKQMDFNKVLKEMDSELDRHIEECRNEKNKARKG
jgi:regulator of replication initiation timing